MDRLANTHGVESNENSDYIPKFSNSTATKIKTRILPKYIRRIFVFMAISVSFYLLTIFYLHDDTEIKMKYRPMLLNNFVYQISQLSRIGYYARDVNNRKHRIYYPNSYDSANSTKEFDNEIFLLRRQLRKAREKGYLDLMSEELKGYMLEKINTDFNFLTYGCLVGSNYVILEAYNIGGGPDPVTDSERAYFIGNYTGFQNAMRDYYNLASENSKSIIYAGLDIFIYITVFYSVALAMLYIFYYFPFLQKEKKKVNKLGFLMSIISQAEENI